MKCPFCAYLEDKVVDSRESREGEAIRRRRECLRCERRFTSYERIDEIPYMVVKKDGRRETFDRNKVMAGLLRACEKRPVPSSKLDAIVNVIEKYVQESSERERPTSKIGEMIMRRLKELDKVAYVRFASVYLEFEDVRNSYGAEAVGTNSRNGLRQESLRQRGPRKEAARPWRSIPCLHRAGTSRIARLRDMRRAVVAALQEATVAEDPWLQVHGLLRSIFARQTTPFTFGRASGT